MSSSSSCSYSASSAIHFSSSSSAAFSRTQVSYRILTWLPVWQFYIANASLLVCPSTPRSSLVPVVCIVPCTVQCNCKFALCKLHCELHESCWWWWWWLYLLPLVVLGWIRTDGRIGRWWAHQTLHREFTHIAKQSNATTQMAKETVPIIKCKFLLAVNSVLLVHCRKICTTAEV